VYVLKKTMWVRRITIYCILSLWELSFFSKHVHPASHSFQSGIKLMSVKIGLFNWIGEIHVSLERNSCVVVAGTSSTLFPMRTKLLFERNVSCKVLLSRWKKAHLLPNTPVQISWQNTCILWKRTISVRSRSIWHIVSLWELS
jgi:hypothetical protein